MHSLGYLQRLRFQMEVEIRRVRFWFRFQAPTEITRTVRVIFGGAWNRDQKRPIFLKLLFKKIPDFQWKEVG